jgi:uncharacterized membrane protein
MTDTPTPIPDPAPQGAPSGAAQAAPDPGRVSVTLDARTMGIAVYALYLIAFFNGGTAIAGLIIAYIVRKDAPDWLKSHFTFQIRTFWIALVAGIVGAATVWVLGLGFLILLAAALWFLVRTVAGLGQLLNNKPYPNPESWLL